MLLVVPEPQSFQVPDTEPQTVVRPCTKVVYTPSQMKELKQATDFAEHPIHGLVNSLLQNNVNLVLEFSRYVHLGPGRTLSRDIFHVEAANLNATWLANQICSLSQKQELALHSRVLQQGQAYHIPMVDFAHVESLETLLEKTVPVSQLLSTDIALYDSGQSMHGYYFCMIGEREWYKYLGKLLLCNGRLAMDEHVVDSRWVGHSLDHGFSALRWSCNSGIYSGLPQLANVFNRRTEHRTMPPTTSFPVFHTD